MARINEEGAQFINRSSSGSRDAILDSVLGEPMCLRDPKLMYSFFGVITDKIILCLKCQEVYNPHFCKCPPAVKTVSCPVFCRILQGPLVKLRFLPALTPFALTYSGLVAESDSMK